ncbi:MFS transporter [Rhodococcus sp. NPDC059968]|jgi:MFS family permease|uniref:MFS transporter n=1 Tax=Rhodococcus sp. NPDC059968 TaxID=3347017 RepID=UPI00366BCFCB
MTIVLKLPPRHGGLRRTAAFTLLAVDVVTLIGASAAPTPLYELYQSQWGFTPLESTLVFGIYAASLLLALLTTGSLSDYIGRRPVLLTALAFEAASMIAFASADGIGLLLVARVVQGFATGAAISVLGAALIDLERTPGRGATVNSIAAPMGLALGAIGSSLISEHLPRPTSTVFLVFVALFALEIVGVCAIPETAVRRPGALASVRPTLAVPAGALHMLLRAGPCLIAVWALGGFYLSLGPSLARTTLGVHSSLTGAITVATLTGTGAVAVFLLRAAAPHQILSVGAAALAAGVATTLAGAETTSSVTLLAGTAVAGVGFGAGFQGTIHTVMPLAQPHERAGLLSSIYMIAYLANSVPALIAGYFVGRIGLIDTARIYGGVVIALAGIGFGTALLPHGRESAEPGARRKRSRV